MNKKRNPLISTVSAQVTSTISVALVLLVLGVVALLGIAARNVSREIRENMGFNVIMTDESTTADANKLKQHLASAPFVASYTFISADDACRQWQEETGEDVATVLEANPFSAEFDVKVKELWANGDSIAALRERVMAMDGVADIVAHTAIIDNINRQINSISLVLIVIAAALLLISFVLINNTVRLTVYSRRFTIHTMKLVGATDGFIRRPFIITNAVHGVVAAIIASGILAAMLYYAHSLDESVAVAVGWSEAAWVFAGTLMVGVLICVLAALLATNKYLRLDYDEMFR